MLARLRKYIPGVRPPIGGEGPRGFVGGLWHELGELQFRFLVDQGLEPHHVLLDIACGSLRAGVRLIPYLDAGCYLGIDIDSSLIEHGRTIELGERLCAIKRPEFVVSGSFEFERFSRRPDYAIAQSLFTHLTPADIGLCLRNLSAVAQPGTVLFATFFEVAQPFANPAQSHPHAPFRYTRDEMRKLGEAAGLRMDYIGAWNHPRDQKMLRFAP
jgi:hypothetical protein